MKKLAIFGCAFVLVFGMAANALAFTIYTDFASWAAACGGIYTTEDFTGNVLHDGGISFVSDNGVINNNQFEDHIFPPNPPPPSVGPKTTTWSFTPQIMAFGGYWDMSPLGPGTGIRVEADSVFVDNIPHDLGNTFWGFTSTTALTSVFLSAGPYPELIAETYNMDNMSYSSVPLPPTLLLLGSGLLGLAGWRRFRKG